MPFETEGQAAERKAAKAQRARKVFERQQAARRAAEEEQLVLLSSVYVRGFDELAALLRVSSRTAHDIARKPGFPKPKIPGDNVRLWKTTDVVAWIDAQEAGE